MSERETFYLRLLKGSDKKSLLISLTAPFVESNVFEITNRKLSFKGNTVGRATRFMITH